MSPKFKALTPEQFLKIPALKPFDDGYETPTPHQIKSLRHIKGWTQVDVAKIAGVSYDEIKNFSSTVSKWESPVDSSRHRTIPYAAWRLLVITPGFIRSNINWLRKT